MARSRPQFDHDNSSEQTLVLDAVRKLTAECTPRTDESRMAGHPEDLNTPTT